MYYFIKTEDNNFKEKKKKDNSLTDSSHSFHRTALGEKEINH